MAFLDDLVTVCVAAGLGTYGTNIFVGLKAALPSDGTPFLLIIGTGGLGPMNTLDKVSPPAYHQPGAQIVARAADYVDAETLIRAAYLAVIAVCNKTINGTQYLQIVARQEPFDLGQDDLSRERLAFNVIATKVYS